MKERLIEVVGAAILKNKKIFAVQRSENMTLSNFWEFPGGKVEDNEDKKSALIREIKEELEVNIEILDYIETAEYQYNFGTVRLHLFTVQISEGRIVLNEHQNSKWLDSSQLTDLNWAPVDISLAKTLKERLG